MARNASSIVTGLDEADMLWLLSVGKLRRLKPGERLVDAGRTLGDLFFVLSGTLAVDRPDGTRMATLDEGQVVGEMSFVDRGPPAVSVRAESDAEVLAVARALILDRFAREPVFAARFYRALAVFLSERLRETTTAFGLPPAAKETGNAAFHGEARFRRMMGLLKGAARD
jgi:CRP/FNR family cyclic AMP-dependent transcriptional regulator